METAKQTLLTLMFDTGYKPTFKDAFAYADVEYYETSVRGSRRSLSRFPGNGQSE